MNNLTWTEQNLSSLGRLFLRNVLDHMRGDAGVTVRFGETGEGVQPNYQVTFSNGVTRTIRGSSHDPFDQADTFDSERLSKSFSIVAVRDAYNA